MRRVYQAGTVAASLCKAELSQMSPTPIVSTVSVQRLGGGLMLPIGLWYLYPFVLAAMRDRRREAGPRPPAWARREP